MIFGEDFFVPVGLTGAVAYPAAPNAEGLRVPVASIAAPAYPAAQETEGSS